MNLEGDQAVAEALDAAHGKAKSAYRRRDSRMYMEIFGNTDEGWRLQEVEVLKETITSTGSRLAWR